MGHQIGVRHGRPNALFGKQPGLDNILQVTAHARGGLSASANPPQALLGMRGKAVKIVP